MQDKYTLKEYIVSDLERLEPASVKSFLSWYFLKDSTFPWHVWFRITQYAKKNKILWYTLGPLIKIVMHHKEFKYGIHANPNITVGVGLNVAHGDGVYLNCAAIGNHVTIFQNVTFGNGGGQMAYPLCKIM